MIRVLLVEDDHAIARSVERLIRRALTQSTEIVHRATAEQAITCLRLAGEDPYTLVISDCNLSGTQTGLDVLAAAREYAPQTKFMFVSSDDRCAGQGVPFLEKPASSELRAAVLELLGQQRAAAFDACPSWASGGES